MAQLTQSTLLGANPKTGIHHESGGLEAFLTAPQALALLGPTNPTTAQRGIALKRRNGLISRSSLKGSPLASYQTEQQDPNPPSPDAPSILNSTLFLPPLPPPPPPPLTLALAPAPSSILPPPPCPRKKKVTFKTD
ncbi:hypothetical protein PCASD_23576 [Puccinia coronata f. sp. avenae]|uniref:Uncharacterized protein n=1 Tax=Puccinia coronata f. sp. avenae TaxID=200324 RepID=A0A2N5SFN0_9BASI|nr:hypothetical protein PCASD_23576 [Puccinia coronata f. sp. avenae]